MAELGHSLERMTFMQLLLLFGFLTCYVLALGRMLGVRKRQRAALVALASAVAFTTLTDPWVHGALLVVFVVAGLGLFVMLAWLLARWLGPRLEPIETAPETVTETVTETLPSQPLPLRQGEAAASTHELARGARATR
jgi:hypothetical protein